MNLPWFILQHEQYGIGNFINCTPTISALFNERKQPIPVLFQRTEVAEMFIEWPAIKEITINEIREKKLRVLFSSELNNQLIPDWEYIYNTVINKNVPVFPHTYVDTPSNQISLEPKSYVVVARGCHAENHVKLKDPGDDTYKQILNWIAPHKKIVFIGATKDYERNIEKMHGWFPKSTCIINDIRMSLSYIRDCSFMITNDTGMYHAAAAMKKPAFVMWKDTNFNKNQAPGKSCFYSFRDWKTDFIRFSRWTDHIPEVE